MPPARSSRLNPNDRNRTEVRLKAAGDPQIAFGRQILPEKKPRPLNSK
jgi:hypothetical protein